MNTENQVTERMKKPEELMEFVKAKGTNSGIYLVVKEVYQPKGFITKFKKDGTARKTLKVGRYIKKCVWVPLTKNYKQIKAQLELENNREIQKVK